MKATRATLRLTSVPTPKQTAILALLHGACTACGSSLGTDDNTESHWLQGRVQAHVAQPSIATDAVATSSEMAAPATVQQSSTATELVIPVPPRNLAETSDTGPMTVDGIETLWVRQWGSVHLDTVDELDADALGNLIIVGHTSVGTDDEGASDRAQYIVKLDPTGEELWKVETPDRRQIDFPQNLVVNAAGHSFVACSIGQKDVVASATRYDSDGIVLWTTSWGEPGTEAVFGVTLDSKDHALVMGRSNGPLDSNHAFLTKLDPTGEVLWTRYFESTAAQVAHEGTVDAADNIVLGLKVGREQGEVDALVKKLDRDGNTLWDHAFNAPEDTRIYSLVTDPAGNVYVGGTHETEPDAGFIAKLTSDGDTLWFQGYPSVDLDEVGGLGFAADGTLVVGTGYTSGAVSIVRFSTDGTLLRSGSFDTPRTDRLFGLVVTGDTVVVAGETFGALTGTNAGRSDSYVLALRAGN